MSFLRSLMPMLQVFSVITLFHIKEVDSFLFPREHMISTRLRLDNNLNCLSNRFESIGQRPRSALSTILRAQEASAATKDVEDENKELTPETIAEMIEVSFLQSCLQLSQGYIDVLKLFIVAVKAGYERSLPLKELHQLVEDCPVNSAGRDLMKEEKELRLEWMRMVYEMLNALNPELAVDSIDGGNDEAMARITEVVNAMLSIQDELENEENTSGGKQDATVALTTLTVEQALERSSSLSTLNESLSSNPMDKAFLTNDIRVALVTFRVLEEEKNCMQDASGRTTSGGGKRMPRPPIPGT